MKIKSFGWQNGIGKLIKWYVKFMHTFIGSDMLDFSGILFLNVSEMLLMCIVCVSI